MEFRLNRVREHVAAKGSVRILERDESLAFWREVRDAAPFARETSRLVWRISVPPAAGAAVLAEIEQALPMAEYFLDWGGGLIWVQPRSFVRVRCRCRSRWRREDSRCCGDDGRARDVDSRQRGCASRCGSVSAAASAARRAVESGESAVRPEADVESRPHVRGSLSAHADAFSPAQLTDPQVAESERILRACVHCGFCTSTCPTYLLTGDELDSPRGRIYLAKDMLEKNRPADPITVKHLDRCLTCLSCMTTCPSGVHYMHLVDHARQHIERTYQRPFDERLMRSVLAFVLPHTGRFRAALGLARLARPFRAGCCRSGCGG